MTISRRGFLKSGAALLLASQFHQSAFARASFSDYPFKLGIASGAPRPDSVVIWTRLAPDPLKGGGLDPVPLEVKWEVSRDEAFHKIVKSGTATAIPAYAHSVHVEVKGLEPAHSYWYRFHGGDAVSQVGRTRTAPRKDALDSIRFAYACCQMYEQGYFTGHKHMAEEDIDLVVFLGDYIYEKSWGKNDVRKHEGGEIFTLDQYRNRYACYKTDSDLQRCHERFPWIVTWDDHEVSNDYANDHGEKPDANFLARRTAAYQAYYEHMPLPPSWAPHNTDMRIYTAYDFGQMARFHVLDDRQYRDYEVRLNGSNYIPDCAERKDASRTMLGTEQEKWLNKSLKESPANWDVLVQQTLMGQVIHDGGMLWTDGWDGYPAARQRLLEAVAQRKSSDAIVIGGDVHAYVVGDLKLDFDKTDSKVVATEFCGTSISSQGPPPAMSKGILENNPHLHYANPDARGYVRVALGKDNADVALRSVESVKVPDAPIFNLANYVVQKGHPGVQKA